MCNSCRAFESTLKIFITWSIKSQQNGPKVKNLGCRQSFFPKLPPKTLYEAALWLQSYKSEYTK